jgi:hypothetical protein
MTEFAGSGGNIFAEISLRPPFAGLYGLTGDEVKAGIARITPPLKAEIGNALFSWMEEQMNGYRLEAGAEKAYFNPARVMYTLGNVQERISAATEPTLAHLLNFKPDRQTKPAESALAVVVANRNSRQLIADLLAAGADGVNGCVEDFSLFSMAESRTDLLSYLYYTGAVTYARGSSAARQRLCVPNLDARKDYLGQAERLLSVHESELEAFQRALPRLIDRDDVEPLVKAFERMDRRRTGHGIFNKEVGFHEALFSALALGRRTADRVETDAPLHATNTKLAPDILYLARSDHRTTKRIYIELRNLRVEDLLLPDGVARVSDWHQRASAFLEWLESNADVVEKCKLTEGAKSSQQDRWAETVRLYLEKAADDVRRKYVPVIMKQLGDAEACTVWVLVRVGIGRVLYKQVQLCKEG